MLEEMQLKLSEAAVYAYIHGLTQSEELGKRGWHGSIRRLAKVLHTSPSTMNDIVNRLEEKGFLNSSNGFIISTIHRDVPTNGTSVRNSDANLEPTTSDVPF